MYEFFDELTLLGLGFLALSAILDSNEKRKESEENASDKEPRNNSF